MNKIRHADLIRDFENSEVYTLIFGKVKEQINNLKTSYEAETIEQLQRIRGTYEGLSFPLQLIEAYKKEGQAEREMEEKIEQRVKERTKTNEPKEI